MKLNTEFYLRDNVIQLAQELIGKVLYTKVDKMLTAGIITETEAYNGIIDRASHAYNGRRTNRNEVMYASGGTAYVYKCYGIHDLFNVVTNRVEVPHAVLIRAIYPLHGTSIMLQRRNMNQLNKNLAGGPGTLTQALGIGMQHNGLSLAGNIIWIEEEDIKIDLKQMKITPRIGVESAGEAAAYPYRFVLELQDVASCIKRI